MSAPIAAPNAGVSHMTEWLDAKSLRPRHGGQDVGGSGPRRRPAASGGRRRARAVRRCRPARTDRCRTRRPADGIRGGDRRAHASSSLTATSSARSAVRQPAADDDGAPVRRLGRPVEGHVAEGHVPARPAGPLRGHDHRHHAAGPRHLRQGADAGEVLHLEPTATGLVDGDAAIGLVARRWRDVGDGGVDGRVAEEPVERGVRAPACGRARPWRCRLRGRRGGPARGCSAIPSAAGPHASQTAVTRSSHHLRLGGGRMACCARRRSVRPHTHTVTSLPPD